MTSSLQQLPDPRADLRADCSRCAGLCCVVPAFTASADFAIDKPAGTPCPNLSPDARCEIHQQLRTRGFAGCAVFDCFGAGQQVVQVTFGPPGGVLASGQHASVAAVFTVMRQLHEVRWYLVEALQRVPRRPLHHQLQRAHERNAALCSGAAHELERLDVGTYRREVGELLGRVSEQLRSEVAGRGPDRSGADLMGRELRREDLRGVSLRGAYLIAADLRGADLWRTDLLGADLRGADIRGARLHGALFLTQPQLDAARGDDATTLPEALRRPLHWQ